MQQNKPDHPAAGGLSAQQRADLGAQIAQRARQLQRELALARSLGAPGLMQVTEPSDADRTVADVDADLALASLRREETELAELDQARARLADGSYGTCTRCGQDIEYRRLLAAPAATRCLKCQAAHERQMGSAHSSL